MAWRQPGDKSLSEPMISLLTHIYITRYRIYTSLGIYELTHFQMQFVQKENYATYILKFPCFSGHNWQ